MCRFQKDIPKGCNVVSFGVSNEPDIMFYREGEELCYWGFSIKGWCSVGNISLEQEVSDDVRNEYDYVYLRLTTKDNSDVFTPDCLVGVETNKGYITHIVVYENFINMGETQYYAYTTESLSKEDLIDVHTLKYYISDESDETVSFTEYVEMFYDGVY